MTNLRPVAYSMGLVMCGVALMLCMPALVDIVDGNTDWWHFISAALVSAFIGGVTVAASWERGPVALTLRQAFLVTIFGWIVVSVLASIPFYGLGYSLTDAVFESMSGITTTGATVFTHLDDLPLGILLWRALLQWVGGIGIIAMAVLMLPLLRVGGMQLFRIESPENADKASARAVRTIFQIFFIYVMLTTACGIIYFYLGMSAFDTITHAMTTLSTGGYSTQDMSFGWFREPALHWFAVLFMLLGSLPFYLYVRALGGDPRRLFDDEQVRCFVSFVAIASVGMAVWLYFQRDTSFLNALLLAAFNVTSVVTTTGCASDDYTMWGVGAAGLFVALSFVGGCSGSTAGAIKMYRLQIVWRIVRAYVKRLYSPNRVITLRYNGNVLADDVPHAILAFLAVFIATVALFTVILSLTGVDFVTAYSSSVTAIANVGPGVGPTVGPSGNFSSLPILAKWVLIVAMLAGRLEVLVFLVALDREFWRP
jgi:trk system potassium uptake protein TrkH